jgi:hypothetical protein
VVAVDSRTSMQSVGRWLRLSVAHSRFGKCDLYDELHCLVGLGSVI